MDGCGTGRRSMRKDSAIGVREKTLVSLLHLSPSVARQRAGRAEGDHMIRNHGAKLLGHPIHPMLVVFPLGLLVTSLIFDFIGLATRNGTWSLVAQYMI